jgi:DNA-binding IclR family transcriptional regulator
MDSPQTSTIVDRVLHVLAGVARAGKPVSAKQIAAMVQQPVSTVYRHLASLKKWGLLQEHMNSGTFEPGPTGVQLAWGFDQNSNLISQSREEIISLVQRSGESVGLLVPINGQMVCIAMEESDQPLRCSFTKGRAHPLLKGASAKSLLAFMPRKLQQTAGRPARRQAEKPPHWKRSSMRFAVAAIPSARAKSTWACGASRYPS